MQSVTNSLCLFCLDLTLSGRARTSKEIVVPNPWSGGTQFLQIWLRHRPWVRCHVAFAYNFGLFFLTWAICSDAPVNGCQRRVKLISVQWEDLLIAEVKLGVIKIFADRRLSQIVLVG